MELSAAEQIAPYEQLTMALEPEVGRVLMALKDVAELSPGNVLKLPSPVGSKLSVRVGDAPFGLAELISAGNKLALKFSSFHGGEAKG